MSEGGSYINSRLVSSAQKREIMWNIIEPGDPYDIRKSMIAQLPGRKNFMGTHLELVCLLQAAEIERLCEYLQEYKLKLREVQRRELDRHSYEIQIKELSQRLSEEGTFRGENAKLKDFIRKQTLELEELRKSAGWEGELGRKYEESLRQVEVLLQENEGLRGREGKLRIEWQQTMSAKTLQMQQLQRRLRQASGRGQGKSEAFFKLQIEFKKLQFQNKRLRQMLEGKNREIEELQGKSKQLLYQVQDLGSQLKQYASVGHTLTQYENRFSLLGQELDRLNLVLREKSGELSETTNRLRVVQEENRRKQERIEELQRRKGQLQQSKRELEGKMLESMRSLSGLDESRSLVRSYEANLQKLSGEIERLNGVLRRKVQELEEANRRLGELEYESRRNDSARKEADEYRGKFADFGKKIVEYENRIALLSQEVERLSQGLKRKGEEVAGLEQQQRGRTAEVESLQKSIQDMEIEFRSQINRLTHVTQTYEVMIGELKRENQQIRAKAQDAYNTAVPSSSPSRAESTVERQYQVEIERLSKLLQVRTSQLQARTSQLQAYERERGGNSDRDSAERQRLVQHYQSELSLRNRELQGLKVTLGEYQKRILSSAQQIKRLSGLLNKSPSPTSSPQRSPDRGEEVLYQRKLTEYENKLAIMNQEIERLNENLRAKGAENKNLQGRLRGLQEASRQGQGGVEVERRVTVVTQQNTTLREQVRVLREQLRGVSGLGSENDSRVRQLLQDNAQLTRKLGQFEFQMTTLSHEIQRLNNVLKLKVEQAGGWEQKVRAAGKELDEARRRNQECEARISSLNYEHDASKDAITKNIQFEYQSLKRRAAELENYNREYQGKVSVFQLKIREYESKSKEYERRVLQSERRAAESEEELRVAYQQREQAGGALNDNKRRFAQYQNKIVVLSQEIERLNDVLERLSRENGELKRRVGEIETLKSTIVNLEERFSRAAQENDELRRGVSESNTTRRQNQEYEFKMRSLGQQNEQLGRSLKETEQKLLSVTREVQRLGSLVKSRGEQSSTLQGRLRSSVQENEVLNRRVQQLTATSRRIGQYDNKISILSGQIQRLNGILKGKVEQVGALQGRCRGYEQQNVTYKRRLQEYETNISRQMQGKIAFLGKENEDLRARVKQLSSQANKIPQWESKFGLVYAQVERLNSNLKMKVEQVGALQGKGRALESDVEKYRRRCEELENTLHRQLKSQSSVFEQRVGQLTEQNQSLRRNVRELSDGNRRLSQSEGRAAALGKEVERLSEVASRYSREVVPGLQEKVRTSSTENEKLRLKLGELTEVNRDYQELLTRYKSAVQEIEQYNRRVQEYQARMSQISTEIERLNTVVRGKVEELGAAEGRLRQANGEVEALTKRLRDSSEVSRRVPEYESKIAILSQEIERLSGLLKGKVEEVHNYQSELRKYSHEYQILQRRCGELQSGLSQQKSGRVQVQQRVSSLLSQNQQMRKAVRELSDSNRRIADYESRMALLSQEIERLNTSLRLKLEELNSVQATLRNYRREAETRVSGLQGELEEQKRRTVESSGVQAARIAEYESKLLVLSQEIERLNYVLKEHGYEIEVVQKKEAQYLAEIERLNNTLRLKVEESGRWEQANNELRLRVKAGEEALLAAGQEYQKLKAAHGTLTEQYTRANKHLVEYEQSINKLYQEFERLQSMLQELKKENYELKTKLQESGNLAEMNRVLQAEIERLNKIVATQNKDLQELRLYVVDQSALQRRISEYMALLVVLFAEIESLRLRVKETEMEIETVRRSSLAPFKI